MVTIEYVLTHAEECTLRLNEAERYVSRARPELDSLRRDLRAAEATLQQAVAERDAAKAAGELRAKGLEQELSRARRPWHRRLFNAGAAT